MARRADPDRIHRARRAAVRNRMVDEFRLSQDAADRWVSAWEERCAVAGIDRASPDYWMDAAGWILEQARRR